MAYAGGGDYDVEATRHLFGGDDKATASYAFAEQEVRLGFVRRVFGLLSAQLAVTAIVTAAVLASPSASASLATPGAFYGSFLASLAVVLVLSCSESARRSHPTNLILLGVFTLCEAFLVATISSLYATSTVLLAALLTLGVTASLSLYAMQTKRDFTATGGILYTLLFCLVGGGLLSVFVRSHALDVVVAAAGAAVMGVYIVFDVQLMIGGHTVGIEPDEYVMAALNIYLDIVNLFLYLLRLVAELQGGNDR